MINKLRISRWRPALLNELTGNYHKANRLKKVDRNMIGYYCLFNRIPVATGRREVSVHIVQAPSDRATDADAYWKSTLDALVHAKMLIDDRDEWCEQGKVTFEKGNERETVITLTDL